MPRGFDNPNYYRRREQSEAQSGDVTLNVREATRDKLAPADMQPVSTPMSTPEGREARASSMSSSNPCGPGYEYITAPTSGKTDALGRPRPRAYFACYSIDKEMEVLVIGMRDTIDKDNTMIQYDGVDPVLWDILKNSDSTTDFINLYLDGAPWSRVSYSNLPRKRPDEFQYGIGR
jgi:hypothetical protein